MVSIPDCHSGDPGSIPGLGAFFIILTDIKKIFEIPPHKNEEKLLAFISCKILLNNKRFYNNIRVTVFD